MAKSSFVLAYNKLFWTKQTYSLRSSFRFLHCRQNGAFTFPTHQALSLLLLVLWHLPAIEVKKGTDTRFFYKANLTGILAQFDNENITQAFWLLPIWVPAALSPCLTWVEGFGFPISDSRRACLHFYWPPTWWEWRMPDHGQAMWPWVACHTSPLMDLQTLFSPMNR